MVIHGNLKACVLWTAFLILVLWGCNRKPPLPISQQIQGEWFSFGNRTEYFRFSGDSVEFGEGLFCKGDSSETARISGFSEYQGHFAPFRVKKDNIFYREPCFGKWRLLGKIGILRNDSLVLKMPVPEPWDSTLTKVEVFTRIKNRPVPSRTFDKIVFSEISWTYSAMTKEISVAENGDVWIAGGTWHQRPDLFYAKLDTIYVNYLFNKFQQAEFINQPEDLDDGVIDGSNTYVTLTKGGKIIKSIKHHHGYRVGYYPGYPVHQLENAYRIFYAYAALKLLPYKFEKENKLQPKPSVLPVTALNNLLFFDGIKFMELSPTEAFFLWTELQKAKPTKTNFKSIYRLLCWERFNFLNEQGKHLTTPLRELVTDGRYYKFPDKNGKPQVFDLGYNFLERNNLSSRFKPADSDDLDMIRRRARGEL